MINKWLAKRKLKRLLSGCNFEVAKTILEKQFGGSVIQNQFAELLNAFSLNPSTDNAINLILYNSDFKKFFELIKNGEFTESIFTQKDIQPMKVDSLSNN